MDTSPACPVSTADCGVQCGDSAVMNYNLQNSPVDGLPHSDIDHDVLRRVYRPHGAFARTLYNKYLADERLQRFDRNKWYSCDTDSLPDRVRDLFLPLSLDDETEEFLSRATGKSDWILTQLWYSIAKAFLGWFMTQTSINGLLGRGSMFVFSVSQLRLLLGAPPDWRGGALLDLGAGDGKITEVMGSLFTEVNVTEVSAPMRWILAKKGYKLLEVDTWSQSGTKFDLISCLNLLDRCDRPLSLLRELRSALSPQGRVIVALVLPFSPYVEIGRPDHQPTEWLPITGSTFEDQITSTISDVFEKEGFVVERWSRLPYLCEGDINQAFYWLDDAIFILRAKDDDMS